MKLSYLLVAVLGLGLGISALAKEGGKKPINDKCPISGKAVDDSKTSSVTASFCCGKCLGKFQKSPGKYLGKVAEAEEGKCPISGKTAKESKTATVVIGFCCGKCKGKFDESPKKYLGKVKPAK
ncbi:MAG: hypothetical protein R3236_02940 [Phycisphaeraceae bacterium]|nr:hypothetical protein [Phycisphaeraceae bacterium]